MVACTRLANGISRGISHKPALPQVQGVGNGAENRHGCPVQLPWKRNRMLLDFFMFPGMSAEASSGRLALGVIPGSPQKHLTVLPPPAPDVFQRHPTPSTGSHQRHHRMTSESQRKDHDGKPDFVRLAGKVSPKQSKHCLWLPMLEPAYCEKTSSHVRACFYKTWSTELRMCRIHLLL